MKNVAAGTSLLDVQFLGYSEAIGPALLEGDGQFAIVDCGPESCLPVLRQELASRNLSTKDLTALLLTHIHLDHAGATGSLVRENPKLRVYVHEKGAPHMAAPEKLLKSAGRLYGANMQRMYGEFLATPAENLHVLTGGESLSIAGRKIEVAYTPGHASHHVSYFDQSTGFAFIGDTTGLRRPRFDYIAPVTPPPDIDLELWRKSLDEIARRKPSHVYLTHFGPFADVDAHLDRAWHGLERWGAASQRLLQGNSADEQRTADFVQMAETEFARHMQKDDTRWYSGVSAPTLSWLGLQRYWSKKNPA
jgi:glyoxylase-like metal-dependent hydrolase (beta-lactamase superfamily II)